MLSKMILLFLFMNLSASQFQTQVVDFKYNGFLTANMSLDGLAQITSTGLLWLTNSSKQQNGHAFYSLPIPFKDSSASGNAFSFSTTFVFAIVSKSYELNGHGMAFVISASKDLTASLSTQYLGLFNDTNNENSSNHMLAIEFDTVKSPEFKDIDNNHVAIDVNSLTSVKSASAGFFTSENGGFRNLSLVSGSPIRVWVEYSSLQKQINVTLSPASIAKPNLPLLSSDMDLSPIIKDSMYVGFASATGAVLASSHYVLGWSFKMNGRAQELDLSRLPKLPRVGHKKKSGVLTTGVPLITVFFLLLTFSAIGFIVRRKIKYAEVLEEWEHEYGPHRFSYKDLFKATKGFRDKELLGIGGFGVVYKGVLPSSNIEVAVKRVAHKSKQGMREFIAEIVSLGRLSHRNLVQLLGYCRRTGELLLVYDFMPNGSLDKFLFDQPTRVVLNWHQRFQIIKGVASGLLYLHEGWEQVVLHRDIKASNVLLDCEFNGMLGDFGLARLYDHGTNPQTTHVVGTMGYIAPELGQTGKATMSTDVFSFGAFVLEVASGKRPIAVTGSPEQMILVDWVLHLWRRGEILDARDVRLGNEYVKEEMELVLKLGLLCSHPMSVIRPTMRQVMLFLDWECPLPALPDNGWDSSDSSVTGEDENLKEMKTLYLYGSTNTAEGFFFESSSSHPSECILSGGR